MRTGSELVRISSDELPFIDERALKYMCGRLRLPELSGEMAKIRNRDDKPDILHLW